MPKLYGLDKHGSHWYWNCGWRCLENEEVILPHTIWRKSIAPNIVAWTEILKPKPKRTSEKHHPRLRPYDTWRRADGKLYDHFLYGEVTLLETDGVHAIVKSRHKNDVPVEVFLENLQQITPRFEPSKNQYRRGSKWGDLKPYIPAARKLLKDSGYEVTDERLVQIASRFKHSEDSMFK